MSKKGSPVEVWSIGCPCGDCDGLIGMGFNTRPDGKGETVYAIPVFEIQEEAKEFFTEWAGGKLPQPRVAALQEKLIRTVRPKEIPSAAQVRCPDGHLHTWKDWYTAIVARGN